MRRNHDNTRRHGQVVVAISGFYVGLYGLSKVLSALFSSPKKEEVGKSSLPSPCSLFTCASKAVSESDATINSVLLSWLELSSWRIEEVCL